MTRKDAAFEYGFGTTEIILSLLPFWGKFKRKTKDNGGNSNSNKQPKNLDDNLAKQENPSSKLKESNNFAESVKSDFKKGDQFEIDYTFVKGSDNLSGKVDLGWYTDSTVYIEIVAILKSPGYSGSLFKNLTSKAERIAIELGLSEVVIEFKMVKNPRLASDASWAAEYGYYFHTTSNKFGTTVTWTKEIK